MGYFIEDFVEASNAASCRDEAFALYCKALERLGFDCAVYTFVTDHLEARQRAGHGVQCRFPGDWMAHYQKKGYLAIDPVTQRVKETFAPFRWRDLLRLDHLSDQQARILHEADDAGLHAGLGIPLYGPRGELAGVGLASSCKDAPSDRDTLCKANLLTNQFHTVYCDLSAREASPERVDDPPTRPLTKREVEVLKWMMQGKTVSEIALIIRCAEDTVKWHKKQCYTKLHANSRLLAVVKAIRLGYITLDEIKVV